MNKKKFRVRVLTSFLLTGEFILIGLTGIILYAAPPGRIAYWLDWRFLGINKTGFQTIHTVFSFLFVITAVLHIYYNWNVLKRYIVVPGAGGINYSRELIVSLAVVAVLIMGSLISIPPFSTLMNLGDAASNSWHSKEDEPPIPHAELMTLREIAERLDLPPENAVEILKKENISVKSPGQRIAGIARSNRTSAKKIYEIIAGAKPGK